MMVSSLFVNILLEDWFIFGFLRVNMLMRIETDGYSGDSHEMEDITSHRYHILPIYCCLQSWMLSLNSTDSSKTVTGFIKATYTNILTQCDVRILCMFCTNVLAVNDLYFF